MCDELIAGRPGRQVENRRNPIFTDAWPESKASAEAPGGSGGDADLVIHRGLRFAATPATLRTETYR